MKRLLSLALSLALAFGPAIAYASPGTIIKGDVLDGFENILVNPSVERSTCTNGWTVAPTSACDGTNLAPGQGRQSVQLTLSTSSGALFYQDVTPIHQFGSTNMEAGMWVKTSTSGLQVCPRSGGTVLTAQCVSVPATGTWQAVSANLIGPASGTVGVALYAPSSIASGTVNVDGAYVGRARNLSQVSQAQEIGSMSISCPGDFQTTSTTFQSLSVASCTYTPSGQAVSAGGTGAQIKFPSLPPGTYYIQAESLFYETSGAGASEAYFQFSDGTNTSREISRVYSATSTNGVPGIFQSFVYTAPQSNITFTLTAKTSGGTAGAQNGPMVIKVLYVPSQSQLALRADQTPASWSGTTSLSGTLTSTSTAGADPGSVTGSVTTTASRNMTCVAATSLDGITCNLPRLGNYQVCYGGTLFQATAGANTNAKLSDGSNADITGYQLVSIAAAGGTGSFGQCANYTATAATVTFKVRGYVSAGTGTFSPSTFSVTELDAGMAAPAFVGSVTSTTTGQIRTESARVVCSSASSITWQSGSWLSAIGNNSSGTCALSYTAGEWSAAPVCTGNIENNAGSIIYGVQFNTQATTGSNMLLTFQSGGTSSNVVSGIVAITCQGPR